MKIILSAFGGKMLSQPIDVPENTTPSFDMVLTQPLTAFCDYAGKTIKENPPFNTRCGFEWTGRYVDKFRYYELTEIIK